MYRCPGSSPRTGLPVAWAAAVAAQIATVLSHAHAVPAVHRDLKPANILVGDDGTGGGRRHPVHGHALPEFDALADAYAAVEGAAGAPALDCLRQAAHCRAALGHTAETLQQFRQVLEHVRAAEGDTSPTAFDMRRNIGLLLVTDRRPAEARAVLQDQDMRLVRGPDHEETRDIADLLERLRLAGG